MTMRPANTGWHEVHRSDVVVVGAGVAGLTCALRAAGRRVTLLTNLPLGRGGNSAWAQGGIAAAMGPTDSPILHARDTLEAGAGLCVSPVVQWLTREAPGHLRRLIEAGARFDRGADGELALGREAAHSRHRILHANGDATGAEIVRALVARVRDAAHVQVVEGAQVLDLALLDGHVAGVLADHGPHRRVLHLARAVVLATGGIGHVYLHTTNPPEATGDGLAMAARAGAALADIEFVQFHPTALDVDADPRPLLTEALRGRGAWLVDENGRRFALDAHPDGELAPRDVVSRATWAHRAAGHRTFLDTRAAIGDAIPTLFPTVFAACQRHGVDPRVQPIPVTPAAHYHMGGIAADTKGRTSLPGLWACGEVASTGVHGANRLASNSLLEALVVGASVAEDITRRATSTMGPAHRVIIPASAPRGPNVSTRDDAVIRRVRDRMWTHVGLVRTEAGLRGAIDELVVLGRRGGAAERLALVARLVATAALERRESRGGHYRADYPDTSPAWQHRSFWRLRADGTPETMSGLELSAGAASADGSLVDGVA